MFLTTLFKFITYNLLACCKGKYINVEHAPCFTPFCLHFCIAKYIKYSVELLFCGVQELPFHKKQWELKRSKSGDLQVVSSTSPLCNSLWINREARRFLVNAFISLYLSSESCRIVSRSITTIPHSFTSCRVEADK